MSTRGFCSELFKHGVSFQATFALKGRMTVLFILPRHNERPGQGGRLADRALIRLSRGFDKQGQRDISPPALLNQGVECQSSSVVMVEGSEACYLQEPPTGIKLTGPWAR